MERWQKQTRFFDPAIGGGGNCAEACLASIFNIPLADMPLFHPLRNENEDHGVAREYWERFDELLRARGFYAVYLEGDRQFDGYYLASGKSSRGCYHMVVYKDGQLVHDPHPSNEGIASVECVWVLIPSDPSRLAA